MIPYPKASLTSIPRGQPFALLTALTPTECAVRLTTAINRQSKSFGNHFGLDHPPTIWGNVADDSFVLSSSVLDPNLFKSYAIATIKPTSNGSKIQGRLCVHPEMWKLGLLWAGTILLFALLVLYNTLDGLHSGATTVKAFAVAVCDVPGAGLVVAAVIGSLYLIGRSASRDLDSALMRFLVEALQANEVEERAKR